MGAAGAPRGHKDFLPLGWTSAVTQRLVLDVERVRGNGFGGKGGAFEGAGGYGVSFVARWELPASRQGMRYDIDGDNGIRCGG